MQIHESICNYMKIHVIMQVLCKYMHIVHWITCKSMQLHLNMQIYAWMRISSLAYGGNRGPPTLHQSETCYVHHSLADIDTKNCSRAKSIKSVGRTFFQDPSELLLLLLETFLQKFDRTDLSWCWRIQLAIDTMREFMLFWVALINNWWLHGRWEIQFLAEWLREDNVISIGSLFSTAHNSSSCNAAVKLGSRSQVWEGRQSQHGADQEQTKKSFSGFFSHSFPLSFAIKVWPRLKSKKRGGLRHLRGRSAISALFPIQTLILFPTELIHNSTV